MIKRKNNKKDNHLIINDNHIIINDNHYDKVLIFSHGLGDNPSSWIFFSKELKKDIKNIKIILTKAPNRKVTINNGIKIPSWYDIKKIPIEPNNNENNEYIEESIKIIHQIIDNELNNKIKSNQIFLGGFSQGASLSLVSGLLYTNANLGGIIMFSGYLLKNQLNNKLNNNDLPIFIGQGNKDNIVKYENAENLNNFLKKKRVSNITLNIYDNMSHSVSMKERYDAINWLKQFINN